MSGEWIWGRHPVLEALRAGRVRRVLLSVQIRDAAMIDQIRELAGDSGVQVQMVPETEIAGHAGGGVSQGVLAEVARIEGSSLASILRLIAQDSRPALLLVAHEIQDPRNLGSLLRTAECAGAHAAVVTRHRSAPLTGTVSKASAGAVFQLPVATVNSSAVAIEQLHRAGIWTVGLAERAEQTIYDVDLSAPSAIVVGSEGRGLRRLTAERVDMMASIPVLGRVSSLNASVAGALALYEAVRQRLT